MFPLSFVEPALLPFDAQLPKIHEIQFPVRSETLSSTSVQNLIVQGSSQLQSDDRNSKIPEIYNSPLLRRFGTADAKILNCTQLLFALV
jgi:hypothetical protein